MWTIRETGEIVTEAELLSRHSNTSGFWPEMVADPVPSGIGADPAAALIFAKSEARGRARDRRQAAEMAGTTFNGIPLPTDLASRSNYAGAALAAILDPAYTVTWKTDAGFVPLSAPQIIAVSQAVRAHVQACFDREAALVADIDAATTAEAVAAININEGWPA